MAQYSAEASTLGWAPGHWPAKFTDTSTDPPRTWVLDRHEAPLGEIVFVRYRSGEDELLVFND